MRCSAKSSIQFRLEVKSIMWEIIILALLLSKGFALDVERDQVKVTAENKLDIGEADVHLHKLERRAISHSKLIKLIIGSNCVYIWPQI